MASDGPTRVLRKLSKERVLDSASVDDEGTPGREPTADRRMDEGRNLAADPVARPAAPRIRERKGRQERLRIRVNGMLQDLSDGTDFGEQTKVHDGHTVRDVSDGGHVVRDEHARQRELALERDESIQDLRLDCDVEGARRLVQDQDLWANAQCTSEGQSLATTAREFMRILVDDSRREADEGQEFRDPLSDLLAPSVLLGLDRLADDLPHTQTRVQRTDGILKHDLDVPPPFQEFLSPEARDIFAFEQDAARGRLVEFRQEPSEGRLT